MTQALYYFVGIGGIGMSSIARYLVEQGYQVAGYDKTPSKITDSLALLGVEITFEEAVSALPKDFTGKNTQVVYTPAIPSNHPQLNYFSSQGNTVMKRAALLGALTQDTFCIAVAGTHGKTTTTAILTHLFSKAGASFTSFVGGLINGASNMVYTGNQYTLVEADEFDRSFLHLSPQLACITSIDADHLDIYEDKNDIEATYAQFAAKVKAPVVVSEATGLAGVQYGFSTHSDFFIDNIQPKKTGYQFDFHTPEKTHVNCYFNQLGLHNLSNAMAAFILANSAGLATEKLFEGWEDFPGVERRLQVLLHTEHRILIDDYAHHPTEINAVYKTLEQAFPQKKKCAVFQPHLFSRTRDFLNEFAVALAQFDRVILLDIYPAREEPIAGITSQALLDCIHNVPAILLAKDALAAHVAGLEEEIIAVMGAGDIGVEVESIKKALEND